jgi:hypothetical protein
VPGSGPRARHPAQRGLTQRHPRVAGGATVEVIGGEHGVVHPDIPVVPNNGYLIDSGVVLYPSDSFDLPGCTVDVLLPTVVAWFKLSEALKL